MELTSNNNNNNIFDLNKADSMDRKRNFIQRLITTILRKESAQAEENFKLIRMIRPPRYKPKPLSQLVMETGFSEKEVKYFYRTFKQESPSGISDEEAFKAVYAKIFPLGESGKYAHIVFNCIDTNKCGKITFDDFMSFISSVQLSSQDDKISLSFLFYDLNRDGVITQEEMLKVSFQIKQVRLMQNKATGRNSFFSK